MNSLLTISKQLLGAVILTAVFFPNWATAQGDTYLTVTDSSQDVVVELTEDDLLAMEQFSVHTENEFVDGLAEFTGPLARDVIALLDALEITTLRLTAVNEYIIEVPVSDILDYDVIFAMSQNGERLSIRDKGPIWVIYPMTDNVELQDRIYNDRLIWQLVKVDIL